MITLYTFGPAFGLPDPSPFVMKTQMLLKLAGLDFETDTGGFGKAPKGKLPYIRDDGEIIADSSFIRLHLEHKYGIDFDAGLDERERGIAFGLEKMLEDHLYWMAICERWLDDENFDKGPRRFFKRVPAVLRPFVIRMARGRVRRNAHGHGMGRHSAPERATLGERASDALAAVLGDRPYFMGEAPCGLDATALAFVAGGLCPLFETALHKAVASHANLVAYRDRMMQAHYPEFV